MFSSNEALSRVSHEFRTPLSAILGFGELLSLDQLSDSQRESVEQILAGGRHLLALVEDLLDLSRVAAGNLSFEPTPLDIEAEIAQTVALIGPLAAEKSLSVDVELAERPFFALADRRRLKQVLLNLISNAIKYNRPGGTITLSVAPDAPGSLRIDVRDTGAGMTQAQVGRLFVPFERLDAAVRGIEGHGLGLAMSKALTEAMGGDIEVASTPGAGSVFTVRLPIAAPPALTATELATAPAQTELLAAA
jgi:signal transduction histidine kinase